MAVFDVGRIAAWAERELFTDTVRIRRGGDGDQEQVLDPVTGELVPGPTTQVVVYEGPGMMQRTQNAVDGQRLDGVPYETPARAPYRLLIPLSAPPVLQHDQVDVTASEVDPQLVGPTWRVTADGDVGTLVVVRAVWCDRDSAGDR